MKTTIIILLALSLSALGWLHQRDTAALAEAQSAAGSLKSEALSLAARNKDIASEATRSNDLAAARAGEVEQLRSEIATLQDQLSVARSRPETPEPPAAPALSLTAPVAVTPVAPPVAAPVGKPDPAPRIAFLRDQIRSWKRQLSEREAAWLQEDRKGGLKATSTRDRQLLRDKVSASIEAANAEIDRLGKGL